MARARVSCLIDHIARERLELACCVESVFLFWRGSGSESGYLSDACYECQFGFGRTE